MVVVAANRVSLQREDSAPGAVGKSGRCIRSVVVTDIAHVERIVVAGVVIAAQGEIVPVHRHTGWLKPKVSRKNVVGVRCGPEFQNLLGSRVDAFRWNLPIVAKLGKLQPCERILDGRW